MVFGFFKKKPLPEVKDKQFGYACPLCERGYSIKFNPADVTEWEGYGSRERSAIIDTTCDFCKAKIELLFFKEGRIMALDKEWEAITDKYNADIEKIEEEVGDIDDMVSEFESDEDSDHTAKIKTLKKKQTQLEARQEKLEESYSKKEDKYQGRHFKWCEKWQNKLERLNY